MSSRTDLSAIVFGGSGAGYGAFRQYIHVADTDGMHATTVRQIYDGDGTATDLWLATNKVKVAQNFYIGAGGVAITDIHDEDDLVSDDANALATQQSIKAYIDAVAAPSTLDALDDTIITAVANGEVLMWSGGADWINRTLAEASISATGHTHTETDITDLGSYIEDITGESVGDLSDVTIAAINDNEILVWETNTLTPQTPSEWLNGLIIQTLAQITIDNIDINGNTISSTSGDINITPVGGSDVVIDAHWEFDGTVLTALTDNNTTITAFAGKNITIEGTTFDNNVVTATTFVGALTGQASTVVTIAGLAPDTATTQAAQGNITSLGTLTTLTVDDITINGNAITSDGASSLTITPTAGQKLILDAHWAFDGVAFTAETDNNTTFTAFAGKNITIESVTFDNNVVTATTFVGALTGEAATVATIAGLAPDTATTQATQPNITTCANLTSVGTLTTLTVDNITINGDLITDASDLTISSSGAGVNINTHTDAGDDFAVNTSMLVIEGDSGNVGIGTTEPIDILSIESTLAQIWLKNTDGGLGANEGAWRIISTASGIFQIKPRTDAGGFIADGLTILRNGNVGIGSSVATSKLYVTGDAYFTADVSALTFTDRTPFYDGDALTAIKNIKGKDGQIDHSSLPEFVQSHKMKDIFESKKKRDENGKLIKDNDGNDVYEDVKTGEEPTIERNIGNMISVNVRALQQLIDKIEYLETKVDNL